MGKDTEISQLVLAWEQGTWLAGLHMAVHKVSMEGAYLLAEGGERGYTLLSRDETWT
jgi:hypothetical protein